MKFDIPQDFNVKKLLNNLDRPFEPLVCDILCQNKTLILLCKAL
jgi:hypothetical protein